MFARVYQLSAETGETVNALQATAPEEGNGMQRLAAVLAEAMTFPVGGEIVVRSGERVGRVFLAHGRIAWVTASTISKTLTTYLLEETAATPADLQAAFDESKKQGENFAETLIRWAIVDAATLHRAMLQQAARCILELGGWFPMIALVVPSSREYQGKFTFTVDEVVAQSAALDPRRCAVLRALFQPPQPAAALQLTAHTTVRINKETMMSLDAILKEFKGIKGYKAAGIMNFTGETVASDTTDLSIDLNMVGATFNDIFRSSHEVCTKIGLQACHEMSIVTPSGTIIMRCTGVSSKVHIHGICILATDGNQALAKMTMEKWLPKAMEQLA
jgi:predicted regulator of Ras-like GTPase activity (Roadblock/LC7/MglB family)